MTLLNNPFVTSGYIAPEYFCDRERETEELLRWLVNENNVAIISTRRMGKTGLIQHCFHLKEITELQKVSLSGNFSNTIWHISGKQKPPIPTESIKPAQRLN